MTAARLAPVIALRARRPPVRATRIPAPPLSRDALLARAAAAARVGQAYMDAAELVDLFPGQVDDEQLQADIDAAMAGLMALVGGA